MSRQPRFAPCGRLPILQCVLVFLFVAAPASAQPTQDNPSSAIEQDEEKLPEDVQRLLDMARGAPAEYTVDILLRLVESAKIPEDEQKKELLEEAFELTTRVQHQIRLQQVGSLMDTAAGQLDRASGAGLDSLSIQARVVTKMLPLDRALARDLFSRIPSPRIPPISCEDTLIPDVSAFYEVLTLVINKGFTVEEIREEEHIHLALAHLNGISSSLQLVPAAQVVGSRIASFDSMRTGGIETSRDQQQVLIEVFAQRLAAITESDREFHRVGRARLPGVVYQIVDQSQHRDFDVHGLIESLRSYLIRHFTRTRCADTVARDEKLLPVLNETLGKIAALRSVEVEPISAEEVEPGDVADGPVFSEYWKTSSSQPLLRAAQHLRFGGGKEYVLEEKRSEPEWQLEAADYFNQLAGWEPAYGESEINFFHMKGALFGGFLDLAPKGDLKRLALQGYMEFLSRSPIQTSHPVEYRSVLNSLVLLARPLSEEGRKKIERAQERGTQIPGLPGDYGEEILSAMRGSKNLVIALYGYAEEVIPMKRE